MSPDAGDYDIEHLNEGLKFDNVSFNYGEGSFKLSKISFEIPEGKTVALVGASGSGKSTIADLIPRFFDILDGSIYVDGKNIKEYKLNH